MTSRNDRTSLILVTLLMAVCSSAQAADVTRHDLTEEEVTAAQDTIRGMLRDPDSAQFRNLISVEGQAGKILVCGEVNSRNGFGGYAGFTRFYGRVRGKMMVADETAIGQYMAKLYCEPIEAVQ